MAGTSMATPILAGNAALVRQYFTDGFYPTGVKTAANAKKPMGALIKALMVNGARIIKNPDGIGQPLRRGNTPVPPASLGIADTVQGHGVVTLMRSLMFNDSPKQFAMRVLAGFCPGTGGGTGTVGGSVPRRRLVDALSCKRKDFLKMQNVANGATKTYTVPINAAAAALGVSVTLAWSDAPGTLNARGPVIINNLDLKVATNGGKQYLPTNPGTGTRVVMARDTTEKVTLTAAELAGVTALTVTVTGTNVPVGPVQPFALVVGGAVGKPVPPKPPVPEDPPGGVVIDVIEAPPPAGGGTKLCA